MTAPVQAAGIVAIYNRGGSGEWKDIEPIGKAHCRLADTLEYGTLVYLAPVAAPVAQGDAHGWLIDGSLVYRLNDIGVNCDEINVTMADGSRKEGPRAARAQAILANIWSPDRLTALQAKCDLLSASLRDICDMQAKHYGNGINTHLELSGLCDAARRVLEVAA